MRIEKINSNQIKCVLEKEELLSRHINVNELAYGSEKAQELFKDMMQQASYEFGFESSNAPLMIEAVPLSSEGIMLIITKVDNPDELEDKLANLPVSPLLSNDEETSSHVDLLEDSLNETLDDLSFTHDNEDTIDTEEPAISAFFVYEFDSLDDVTHVANYLTDFPFDRSKVYKSEALKTFIFTMSSEAISKDACKVVRGVLSEYGEAIHCRKSKLNYYDEHYTTLIKKDAIRILSQL